MGSTRIDRNQDIVAGSGICQVELNIGALSTCLTIMKVSDQSRHLQYQLVSLSPDWINRFGYIY